MSSQGMLWVPKGETVASSSSRADTSGASHGKSCSYPVWNPVLAQSCMSGLVGLSPAPGISGKKCPLVPPIHSCIAAQHSGKISPRKERSNNGTGLLREEVDSLSLEVFQKWVDVVLCGLVALGVVDQSLDWWSWRFPDIEQWRWDVAYGREKSTICCQKYKLNSQTRC